MFYFHTSKVSKRGKIFGGPRRSVNIKKELSPFLFQIIILGCLEQERLIIVFHKYLKKNGDEYENYFYKCAF